MPTRGGGDLLQAAREHLHPAERQAADALIGADSTLLALPVARLADLAGVSQATFVRLAQRLGFRTFRELRLELAGDRASAADRTVFESLAPDDTPQQIAEKIATMSTAAIDEGRRLIDADAMARVAAALPRAPRIEAYGVGASGLAALDAAAKLRRVGLPAWSYPDPHQQAQSATLLGKGCVALAFSHSGATQDVLRASAFARRANATVVALTSFPLSPLAVMADELLVTAAATEPTERSGSTLARLSQLYATDVLTAIYSVAQPRKSRDALRRTTEAVDDRRAAGHRAQTQDDR